MKPFIAAAVAGGALVLAATAFAQPPALAPVGKSVSIPPALAPTRLGSLGLNVTDIDKMRDFYTKVLGFKVIRTYDRDGKPYEYVLNLAADGSGGANLLLLVGARQPGSTSYGRIVMYVPNADALAKYMTDNGWPARKVAEGAYFIRDPEGNNFEFFQPPTPAR